MKQTSNSTKVWNTLNATKRKLQGQTFEEASLFVPDQSMSMRELLKRQQLGLPVATTRLPIFTDENELTLSKGINLKSLDLVELQIIRDKAEKQILEHHEFTISEKKRKQAAELEKRIQEAAQKLAEEKP